MTWTDRIRGLLGWSAARVAEVDASVGAEARKRADTPALAAADESRTLCVGWLVDWLHTEPYPREVLASALRLASTDEDALRRRTVAAAATFAGFDVPGGADEYIGRETSHRDIYGADYHLPILAYLGDDDVAEARRIFAVLAEKRPDDVRTPIGLAGLADLDGEPLRAVRQLERALELAARLPERTRDMRRSWWEPALLDHRAALLGPTALSAEQAAGAVEIAELASRGELDLLRTRLRIPDRSDAALHALARRVAAAYQPLDAAARRLLLIAARLERVRRPFPRPGEVPLHQEAARSAASMRESVPDWARRRPPP